jgi:hypothetical protein
MRSRLRCGHLWSVLQVLDFQVYQHWLGHYELQRRPARCRLRLSFRIEGRWKFSQPEALPGFAKELVPLKVDAPWRWRLLQ